MAKSPKKEDRKVQKEEQPQDASLPPEIREKLAALKAKLEKFQKSVVEKFDKYIKGIALMPPPKAPPASLPPEILAEEQKRYDQIKDKHHLLVLIDDTEPSKMSKQELKDKLTAIMDTTAGEIDKTIVPQTLLMTELWQNCYDGKYDWLQLIALSAPVYDTGMLGAIKIAEVHKSMVLKKFEKYIVAYCLGGSLVTGRATKESDIDVFIVIDDTDVKKMTRAELKDKLRAIIINMGMDAGDITGIKNKINIQTYILTDFWDAIREANPVMFTFLRDGVPFFDRGIFMPWKQLLKMGKIKPSPEAIDMYMSTGEQGLERIRFRFKDIATEDFFWSILTPTQAALMLYGVPPPAPKETCEVLREIFVKKEKLLEEEYVKMLENVIQTRKDIEHGVKKEVTGKELDKLLEDSEKYMKRLKKLFAQIEKTKEEEMIVSLHETLLTVIRDVLKAEGEEKVLEEELISTFEDKLISTGKIPARFLRLLNEFLEAKKAYDAGKLTKTDLEKTRKNSSELVKFLVEHLQRRRGREIEQTKVRVKYGDKFGEVTLLGPVAFVIRNLDAPEKVIEKAAVERDGSLGPLQPSSWEEFEKALSKTAILPKVFIREPIFESLKKIFGKDVEVLVTQ
ncbi:MAG: nucleotidyltransferase domain-containing protein [Candidatus Woesearchaeota archaeon]